MKISVNVDFYFGFKEEQLCLPDDKDMNPLPNLPNKNFLEK